MTTTFAFKILFEIGLVMLLIYGFKNEDRLIAFETEFFAVVKFIFKKYILKNTGKNINKTQTLTSQNPRVSAPVEVEVPVRSMRRTAKVSAYDYETDTYSGTGTAATRRVRAEIKKFPTSSVA